MWDIYLFIFLWSKFQQSSGLGAKMWGIFFSVTMPHVSLRNHCCQFCGKTQLKFCNTAFHIIMRFLGKILQDMFVVILYYAHFKNDHSMWLEVVFTLVNTDTLWSLLGHSQWRHKGPLQFFVDLENVSVATSEPTDFSADVWGFLGHLNMWLLGQEWHIWGCPGGPVVKNLPANLGDTGPIPDPGRSHTPWSN